MPVLVCIYAEHDLFGRAVVVLFVGNWWEELGMVVCLLIATEWMAIAGPAWAVRTVTVPC